MISLLRFRRRSNWRVTGDEHKRLVLVGGYRYPDIKFKFTGLLLRKLGLFSHGVRTYRFVRLCLQSALKRVWSPLHRNIRNSKSQFYLTTFSNLSRRIGGRVRCKRKLEMGHGYFTLSYKVFMCRDQKWISVPPKKMFADPIYEYQLIDGSVFSKSRFICLEDSKTIAIEHFIDLAKDYVTESSFANFYNGALHLRRGRLEILFPDFEFSYAPVIFTSGTSDNYAHFMSEILPSIHAFSQNTPTPSTIIIDSDLPETLLEAIKAVIKCDDQLLSIPAKSMLKVRDFSFVTSSGYIPIEALGAKRFALRHQGRFNGRALDAMVSTLRDKCQSVKTNKLASRILICRSGAHRTLLNQSEVLEGLEKYSFAPVFPEKLSFLDQIKLFENAEVIVAVTGAALVNCLFCKPKTVVFVLTNDSKFMIFDYWASLLASKGIVLRYFTGNSTKAELDTHEIHGSFQIGVSSLVRELREYLSR